MAGLQTLIAMLLTFTSFLGVFALYHDSIRGIRMVCNQIICDLSALFYSNEL